jgi:outer membrane lipoprotein carrier protein
LLITALQAMAVEDANRLTRFLDGLNTLKAGFEQTVVVAGEQDSLASAGIFYLNRPGKFRWSYTEPPGQEVVADGDRVWLYDADLEQVSHQAQKKALRGTPALLLSDTGPIEKHFDVLERGDRMGLFWLELIPKNPESEITKVSIGFEGERLDQLEMIDNFGQVTRFFFHDIERNPPLPAHLFRFDPPPGVDILSD